MATYMLQVAYTPEAWARLVSNPQDRSEAIRPAIEALGGRVIGFWNTFGEYDVVVILEMPDNVAAAAFAIAAAAGGALKALKTTPLLTPEEGVEALRRVPQSGYQPPS